MPTSATLGQATANTFTPFWLETNSIWGPITTRQEWETAKANYTRFSRNPDKNLALAFRYQELPGTRATSPKFGYVDNHAARPLQTLGKFFAASGMEW